VVQELAHLGALVFGPLANRGTTANGGILLLDFGRPALGDQRSKVVLKAAKGNEIAIGLVGESVITKHLDYQAKDDIQIVC